MRIIAVIQCQFFDLKVLPNRIELSTYPYQYHTKLEHEIILNNLFNYQKKFG